jgi:uncharacterized protein YcbK (DUF882 family)
MAGTRSRSRTVLSTLVVAAALGVQSEPRAAATQATLVRIERPILGEAALLSLRPDDQGIDPRASQQLEELMRDRVTGESTQPDPELLRLLAELGEAFPGRTVSIVHGYADPERGLPAASHSEGRALDLRIAGVACEEVKRLLSTRPELLALVGCIEGASFFHVDVGRGRGL